MNLLFENVICKDIFLHANEVDVGSTSAIYIDNIQS